MSASRVFTFFKAKEKASSYVKIIASVNCDETERYRRIRLDKIKEDDKENLGSILHSKINVIDNYFVCKR